MDDRFRLGRGEGSSDADPALALHGDLASAPTQARGRLTTFRFRDLSIDGRSRAGDATWFRINPPGIAFDVGRGALRLTGARDLFLTHGHLDHASGLPFLLSHRTMQGLDEPTRVYCPEGTAQSLERFVSAAAELEGRSYRYELTPLSPGDRVEVRKDFKVEAFPTDHPVPSLGYHLLRTKRRLAQELEGREPEEIARLRAAGTEVSAEVEELLLSYCGDTAASVFEAEPRLFESTVLMLETTYLGAALRERGNEFGHMHIDDLIDLEPRFANEVIVLHHLSRRHRPSELRRAVNDRLPRLAERVHVWGADR